EIAAAGFTITEVATRTGIPRVSIDRWVKGTRLVTIANLYRICAAIELDPRLLIERATLRHHDTHTSPPPAAPNDASRHEHQHLDAPDRKDRRHDEQRPHHRDRRTPHELRGRPL